MSRRLVWSNPAKEDWHAPASIRHTIRHRFTDGLSIRARLLRSTSLIDASYTGSKEVLCHDQRDRRTSPFFLPLARFFRFPFRFSELGNVGGRGYWRGKRRNGAKYTVFQRNRRIHFSRFRASNLYRQDGGATDNDRDSSNLLSSFFLSFLPFLYLSSPSLLLSSPSSPAISSVHPRTRTFHRQDPAFIVA